MVSAILTTMLQGNWRKGKGREGERGSFVVGSKYKADNSLTGDRSVEPCKI